MNAQSHSPVPRYVAFLEGGPVDGGDCLLPEAWDRIEVPIPPPFVVRSDEQLVYKDGVQPTAYYYREKAFLGRPGALADLADDDPAYGLEQLKYVYRSGMRIEGSADAS